MDELMPPVTIPSEIFDDLARDRMLFLRGEITVSSSIELVANLLLLEKISASEEIVVYINSIGGDLGGLMSIYDAFQSIQCPVKTVCVGGAYSAAAVLLAAGSKGLRLAYPNSKIMIHDIQLADLSGSRSEIEKESRLIKQDSRSMVEIIARHTGQSLRKIKRDVKTDKYFTPKEALQYGLIDEIVKYSKEIPELKKT